MSAQPNGDQSEWSDVIVMNTVNGPQKTVIECPRCGVRDSITHPRGTNIGISHYCSKDFNKVKRDEWELHLREYHARAKVQQSELTEAHRHNAKLGRRIAAQRQVIRNLQDGDAVIVRVTSNAAWVELILTALCGAGFGYFGYRLIQANWDGMGAIALLVTIGFGIRLGTWKADRS